jgi:hypothetical protein
MTEAPSREQAASLDEPTAQRPDAETPSRGRRLLTSVTLVAAVFFVLAGIGSPLLGTSVLAATDELAKTSPYLDSGLAGIQTQNTYMDDTYDAALPGTILYADTVRGGEPANWNPYVSGGTPLGAITNYALFNPISLPYYLLPDWLAPAYSKLLELAVALLGGYLFLRRLSLSKSAALLGGMVFTSTAFMVVWTNWPQTRVAAMIPWIFWAAERLIQRRRPTDAVLLALPVAFMLLGGFPAVTAFTLMSAGVYFLVRVFAEYPKQWKRNVGLVLGAGGGLTAGVALSAIQLLPFAAFYSSWLVEGRAQTPDEHLGLAELTTSIAPWAMGSVQEGDFPTWYLPHFERNMVEALSYVGAAALVLALVAILLPRAGRTLLPRGAWLLLVVGALAWATLIYVPGPLALMQELPVFSSNFVGRARSVLGFLLAVLAAIGFELLLRNRQRVAAAVRASGWRIAWGVVVVLGAAAVGAVVWRAGRQAATDMDNRVGTAAGSRLDHVDEQMLIGLAFVAAAVLAAVLLYVSAGRRATGWRAARFGAAALLPVLVAVQGLSLVIPYYPRVDKDTYYPTTDVHAFLADNLGHERFAGMGDAMVMGVDAPKRLRALTGHTFLNAEFAAMLRGLPGESIPYPTYVRLAPNAETAASPVLDRLAVRYLVTSPRVPVFGVARRDTGDGSTVSLGEGERVGAPVPGTGPVRAVGITPTGPLGVELTRRPDPDRWVEVEVKDESGTTVATNKRLAVGMTEGTPFMIPVDADDVPANTRLTAEFVVHTGDPLTVRGAAGAPAVASVAADDDGVRLAHAGSAVVWERTTALPRIRWASRVVTDADQDDRIDLLAGGELGPDEVVLGKDGGAADGEPATVEVTDDGTDSIEATVDAQGDGYLVVADADQVGWAATVDGEPAELLPADQGVVAVAVPAGTHTVRLHYTAPYRNAGMWLTALTILVLIALVAADQVIGRRRRRGNAARLGSAGQARPDSTQSGEQWATRP